MTIGERIIPTPASPSVCTFTLLSNGLPVPPVHQVLSIVTQNEVNRVPTATIIIRDGDAASQSFAASDTDLFIPGKKITIKAGYQANEETVFVGMVISNSLKIRDQSSVLIVTLKDEAFKMTVGRNSRYFRDQSDSDVMEEIIRAHGLQAEVAISGSAEPERVQFNCSDWDFVLMRAEMTGMICTVKDGKITIAPPNLQLPETLTLQFGATLLEFDAEIDVRTQFKSVKSISWGVSDQAKLETEENTSTVREAGNISANDLAAVHGVDPLIQIHSGNLAEPELQTWSKTALLRSRLAKHRGRAKFQGFAGIEPGRLVKLRGVGERFNGTMFVSGVRHEIADGNWVTDVQLGLDPTWFAEKFNAAAPRSAGMAPHVSGLQIGVVTQIENDPLGEHRLMVRIPVINDQDEGTWVRVASLDAGNNRGAYFRPEIGDEVVVGFLNDDPRHPIALGALNSSAKPAPIESKDDNHEKGFVTRSGMKWIFNDEKKNMIIETPDGNKILLSGEDKSIAIQDQHGNKLLFNAEGITLESAKNVTIKATAELQAEGVSATVKGSGSAEYSSGGTTILKGSIVQIN